jgi:membrane protease subunit (stomatin/prohibitin family)
MPRRGRPLMKAAVVGGAAYHVGKGRARKRNAEEEQDAQIAELQQTQNQAPQQAAPAAPASAEEGMADQLAKLKSLLDSGVLTQDEFAAAKQKIIQGG